MNIILISITNHIALCFTKLTIFCMLDSGRYYGNVCRLNGRTADSKISRPLFKPFQRKPCDW